MTEAEYLRAACEALSALPGTSADAASARLRDGSPGPRRTRTRFQPGGLPRDRPAAARPAIRVPAHRAGARPHAAGCALGRARLISIYCSSKTPSPTTPSSRSRTRAWSSEPSCWSRSRRSGSAAKGMPDIDVAGLGRAAARTQPVGPTTPRKGAGEHDSGRLEASSHDPPLRRQPFRRTSASAEFRRAGARRRHRRAHRRHRRGAPLARGTAHQVRPSRRPPRSSPRAASPRPSARVTRPSCTCRHPRAGAGLCDEEAVRVLVSEGPDRVRELMEICPRFDKVDGRDRARARGRPLAAAHRARRR